MCNSEQLWESIVERHCDTVTEDMKQYAGEVGWKHVSFFSFPRWLKATVSKSFSYRSYNCCRFTSCIIQ